MRWPTFDFFQKNLTEIKTSLTCTLHTKEKKKKYGQSCFKFINFCNFRTGSSKVLILTVICSSYHGLCGHVSVKVPEGFNFQIRHRNSDPAFTTNTRWKLFIAFTEEEIRVRIGFVLFCFAGQKPTFNAFYARVTRENLQLEDLNSDESGLIGT